MSTATAIARRAAPSGHTRLRRATAGPRVKTAIGTGLAAIAAVYVLAPIYWLIVASSKNTGQLFSTSTFLPPSHLSWAANLNSLFTVDGGYFGYWLLNSLLYALVTAILATAVSTLCGYALAKYDFPGRRALFGVVVCSFLVPATALVVPLFLLEHDVHLINSYEGLVLPLLVYPFGVYFMSLFAADAVPDALIDAARVDGAGELRTFWKVSRHVLMPGMVTLFLLSFIGTWNNYFLPLVLMGSTVRFPLTVGLSAWASSLNAPGAGQPLYPEVILGSLLSVLPMLVMFPFLQKYIARGLTFGATVG
ncbi:MAG TPA: carbohydrate ABC transporter permease [Acidimicrobiales bacterium]|nr:carbohydrate ABC transporter permease [Acidimicrobiales bacterium]